MHVRNLLHREGDRAILESARVPIRQRFGILCVPSDTSSLYKSLHLLRLQAQASDEIHDCNWSMVPNHDLSLD